MEYPDKNHHLEITYSDPNNNQGLRKEIIEIFTESGFKNPTFTGPDASNMTNLLIKSETDLRFLLRKIEDCINRHNSSITFTFFW